MTGRVTEVPTGYVSLVEAARRAERSVRTVQRWVEAGLVETVQHPVDRRRRLVGIASLDRALERLTEPPAAAMASLMEHEVDRAAVLASARGLSRQAGLSAAAVGIGLTGPPDEDLLDSPFANRLWILVGAVRGTRDEPPDVIQQALADVLLTLYSDPITRRVEVPDEFWSASLIGRHVARAQLLLHAATGLVSLNEIVATVGIPRARVENILQAIGAERLYDPDEARWLYSRDAIAAVQSWQSDLDTASGKNSAAPEAPQPSQAGTDSAPADFPPTENRRELRATRDAYHRRYFPVPGQ